MNQNLSIIFYLRKAKADRNGLVPIYMRVTFDGKRSEISAHRKIDPNFWDSSVGEANPTKEENIILNNYLSGLKAKALKQYNILESLDERTTSEAIKNRLTGVSAKKHTLLEIFRYHNEQLKQNVGINYALGTYNRYKVTIGKVEAFMKFRYRKSDIEVEELNYQFITNFEMYLKTHDHCSQNTTMKHIVRLKKITNLAIANDWLQKNPFINYKCTYKETKRGYLTQNELSTLENTFIPLQRLSMVRDVFIFCCYTGLAHADVKKLKPSDVSTGMDGGKWIITYRQKTDSRSPIPLLPKALEIIKKYKDYPANLSNGTLLPVLSNQKMNSYLKDIAKFLGITSRLTTHLARHTFATTVTLANGVPIETVSKMLGHTDIKTTQIYSKVVDSKISQDMQMLKNKMQKTKLKKVV